MARLGIELGRDSLRGVRLAGGPRGRVLSAEVPWDPDDPLPGVRDLAVALGSGGSVFAAVDLSLLVVKRLALPPVRVREKRRLVRLDAARYFASPGDLAVAAREDDGLVFALPEERLTAWTEALAELGPVERVEPGPAALARALARQGVREGSVLRRGADGHQVIELRDGRLAGARRPFEQDGMPALKYPGAPAAVGNGEETLEGPRPGTLILDPWEEELAADLRREHPEIEVRSSPAPRGLEPRFLTARGAALDPEGGWTEALLTDELERRQRWRRAGRLTLAAAACAAALVFAILSLDARRQRALDDLELRTAALEEPAAVSLALQTRATGLRDDILAVAAIEAGRPEPLGGLLELTRLLPPEAWVESIRGTPEEWQIDGYAPDAAALVPLFEDDPRFEDVRSVAGTTRRVLDGETYENFSLVLRRVRAP